MPGLHPSGNQFRAGIQLPPDFTIVVLGRQDLALRAALESVPEPSSTAAMPNVERDQRCTTGISKVSAVQTLCQSAPEPGAARRM